MRDIDTWNLQAKLRVAQNMFPPRILRDLENIPPFNELWLENLYIWGDVGTGKTLEAASILLEAAKHRYLKAESGKLLFTSVPELILEIQDTFHRVEYTQLDVLNKYSEARFLVLDDLGSEKPTEFVMTTLYLIINRRYEALHPTVITSNFDLDTMADRLGDDRITSRIEREYKIKHKTGKWKK